jgi:hypothetical protein
MRNDKPGRYPIPARNSMGTATNFYSWVWVRVRITTRNIFASGQVIALPNLNLPRCHLYQWYATGTCAFTMLTVPMTLVLSSGTCAFTTLAVPTTLVPSSGTCAFTSNHITCSCPACGSCGSCSSRSCVEAEAIGRRRGTPAVSWGCGSWVNLSASVGLNKLIQD